jgi:hypothetical protein
MQERHSDKPILRQSHQISIEMVILSRIHARLNLWVEQPNPDPDTVMMQLATNRTAQLAASISAAPREGDNVMRNTIMAFVRGHPGVRFPKDVNMRKPAAKVAHLGAESTGCHLKECGRFPCVSLAIEAGTIDLQYLLEMKIPVSYFQTRLPFLDQIVEEELRTVVNFSGRIHDPIRNLNPGSVNIAPIVSHNHLLQVECLAHRRTTSQTSVQGDSQQNSQTGMFTSGCLDHYKDYQHRVHSLSHLGCALR